LTRKLLPVVLSLMLMFSLSACVNPGEEPLYTLEMPNNPSDDTPSSATTDPSEETKTNEIDTGLVFEITPDLDCTMKSGKLILTVSNARVVNNASEIEYLDGLYDSVVPVYDQDGEHIYKYNSERWPSFVGENGDFVDGVHLILIDVKVQSIDAHMRTIYDADENGLNAGKYEDPYVLRSDHLVSLADLSGKISNTDAAYVFSSGVGHGSFKTWYEAYFSKSGDRSEHPAAYYLMPGETVEYTIGYLIGNNSDGTARDLDNLYLTIAFAKYSEDDSPSIDKTYYIKLGLGE